MWYQASTRFSQIVGEQPTSAVTIAGALSGLGSSRVSDYDLPEMRIEGGRPECDARLAGNVVPTSIWSARHDGSIAFVDDLERKSADVQDDPNGGGSTRYTPTTDSGPWRVGRRRCEPAGHFMMSTERGSAAADTSGFSWMASRFGMTKVARCVGSARRPP